MSVYIIILTIEFFVLKFDIMVIDKVLMVYEVKL